MGPNVLSTAVSLVVKSSKCDKWTKICKKHWYRIFFLSLYECVFLFWMCVCVHQRHHLSSSPEAKTTCCQYWWFVLQYLCGLGSEVTSHRQSGVNGACVTLDKRLRALEQSQGRCPVCVAVYMCVCVCLCVLYTLISLNLSHCNRINSCLFLSIWPCWWSLYPYFSSWLQTSP